MERLAKVVRVAVRGKSVHVAVIGVPQFSVSPAKPSGKTRQSPMICSRPPSGKMPEGNPVVEEALAQVARVEVRVKVILAVAAMLADKASRAVAIVRPGRTIRQLDLSRIP